MVAFRQSIRDPTLSSEGSALWESTPDLVRIDRAGPGLQWWVDPLPARDGGRDGDECGRGGAARSCGPAAGLLVRQKSSASALWDLGTCHLIPPVISSHLPG